MKVMITGHRPQRIKGREKEIKKWIEEQLEELQPHKAINGMAQGVDQIFAFVAKEKGIQLVNVYPHYRINFHQDEEYLNEGALIVFYAEKYNKKNYTERDKKMVDAADICLVVWDGIPAGGTYYTMRYAEEQGKEIRYFPWQ